MTKRVTLTGLSAMLLVACGSTASPSSSSVASGSPEVPSTTASLSPSSVPGSTASSAPGGAVGAKGWREVGSFDAPDRVEQITAVMFGADQFVAVGTYYAAGQLSEGYVPPHEGRVWLSQDGETWEPLPSQPTFEDALLTDLVAAHDGSLLAFGSIESGTGSADQAAVWRSHDGRTWERVDHGFPNDFVVVQVVRGAKGYLLFGWPQDPTAAQLWLSADGLAWEAVDLAVQMAPVGAEIGPIHGIGAGDDGFVALFEAVSGDSDVTIASADGREWFLGDGVPGGGSLAPMGGDWVAVVVPGVVEFPVDLQMWFSANGLAWRQVATLHDPQDRDSFGYVGGLLPAGGRLFLSVTLSFCCEGAPIPGGVWSSQDGTTWEQTDTGTDSLVVSGAERDGTVVLAGYVGGRVTFWVNQRP